MTSISKRRKRNNAETAEVVVYPNLKFYHFRSEHGQGSCTVGYYVDFKTQKVFYTVAHCCPTDNFCRRIGRDICAGRMRKHGPYGEFGYKEYDEVKWYFIEKYHPDTQIVPLDTDAAHTARWGYLPNPNKGAVAQ